MKICDMKHIEKPRNDTERYVIYQVNKELVFQSNQLIILLMPSQMYLANNVNVEAYNFILLNNFKHVVASRIHHPQY